MRRVDIIRPIVMVALGMRVDQIIATEFVEDGWVTVGHSPVAPILEGFYVVDRLIPKNTGLDTGRLFCTLSLPYWADNFSAIAKCSCRWGRVCAAQRFSAELSPSFAYFPKRATASLCPSSCIRS